MEHQRNSRTPKSNKTRNAGGIAEHPETVAEQRSTLEHPGIATERQRHTNGTSRKNGTIQNEEQL